MSQKVVLCLLGLLAAYPSWAQPTRDSTFTHPPNRRLQAIVIGGSATYVLSMAGLYQLWYAHQPRSNFHFYNDNANWNQIDKMGHFYSSFYLSKAGVDLLQWADVPLKKALVIDNLFGLIFLTPIEIFDGYSATYGASWGDELADELGDAFLTAQLLLWKEARFYPKFSFHTTSYAQDRPNLLGHSFLERGLKDYNGQTYWLSLPIKCWLPQGSRFPAWLQLAVGYGARGMVYGDPHDNERHGYQSYRRYFLALDINLRQIKTKSKALRTLLGLADMVHLPLPSLEYNPRDGWRAHAFYF